MRLNRAQLERYLRTLERQPVEVLSVKRLGDLAEPDEDAVAPDNNRGKIKSFGYGKPVYIRYCTGSERTGKHEHQVVLHTASTSPFGCEYRADRAAAAIRAHDDFTRLPQHVRALDVGLITAWGELGSTAAADEYFWLTRYAPGWPYAEDLLRLRDGGALRKVDIERATGLALYLAETHRHRSDEPVRYRRHLRDVFGSGEGIAGLMDNYPSAMEGATPCWLETVETRCVAWHWRLRQSGRPAAQIHGDFHPYNVIVDENGNHNSEYNGGPFHLLDRSRSPWGEPADDVSCMAINYLFFSLQRSGTLASPFTELWQAFWQTYLHESGDDQLLTVVQPFLVWRALVLGSPLWYQVDDGVRRTLYRFIDRVLETRYFDPQQISTYLGAGESE